MYNFDLRENETRNTSICVLSKRYMFGCVVVCNTTDVLSQVWLDSEVFSEVFRETC